MFVTCWTSLHFSGYRMVSGTNNHSSVDLFHDSQMKESSKSPECKTNREIAKALSYDYTLVLSITV